MKILAIGDLHGQMPVIPKEDFDVIILVGDIADDSKIGPLYKAFFRKLKHDRDDNNFEKFVAKKLKSKTKLKQYERESLKKGREILKYLNSLGKPIFMVAGNWDQSYGKTRIKDMNKSDYNYLKFFYDSWKGDKLNNKLVGGLKNIKNCMLHCKKFKGINFIGYGLSSKFEDISMLIKNTKGKKLNLKKQEIEKLKKAYKKIVDKLSNVYKKRNKKFPVIFITHNIPHNTKLDKITDKKSYAYKKHLGSTIAKDFCVKNQPVICVGGHIHDGKGKTKIKKTLVLNPGFGKKAQILIDFNQEKGKVDSVEFIK